jgi:hypothetical protein
MGQRGFWDEHQRVAKLQKKKPVLKRLSESIPWESFRPLLERGYTHERKSNAGRKRIDPMIRTRSGVGTAHCELQPC